MRALQTRGIVAMTMLVALLLSTTFASGEEAKPELANVRLAVGGKPALFYLPLRRNDQRTAGGISAPYSR